MEQIPTYSRQYLRQTLGRFYLNETSLGNVGSGQALTAGSTAVFVDPNYADASASGDSQYVRAWLYETTTAQTFRVASFNAASGAFVTMQPTATAVGSGAQFEVHEALSPQNLNSCLDRTVSRLRTRYEVGIQSVDSAYFYAIDNAASPNSIQQVLDVYYYAQPTATDNVDRREFRWFGVDQTATANLLRINPPIAGSLQIIMDAIVDMTLGAADTATITIPHDEWVVWGAAAQAFHLLVLKTPGQESQRYQQRRQEAAISWDKLNAKFQPTISRRIMFEDDPVVKGTR